MGKLEFTDKDIALFTSLYDDAYQHAGKAHNKTEELRGDSIAQWIVIYALIAQCSNRKLLISNLEWLTKVMRQKVPSTQRQHFEETIKTCDEIIRFFQRCQQTRPSDPLNRRSSGS